MGYLNIVIALFLATIKTTVSKYREYNAKKTQKGFNRNIFIRSAFTSFGYFSLSYYGFLTIIQFIKLESVVKIPAIPADIAAYAILALVDFLADKTSPHFAFSKEEQKRFGGSILTPEVSKAFLYWVYTTIGLVIYIIILNILVYFAS